MAPLSLKIILDEGAVTRTVMFESGAKVSAAYDVIRERIHTPDNGKEYALFLTSADDDRSGIWLDPHQRLEYYMLRNGDSLLYLHKQRNLRVKMLDGTVKTLQVDESKNIGDLMMVICGKIGITNHDEYGLCQEESLEEEGKENKEGKPAGGTLTLKRRAQQRERDAKMDQLSKKLKTDDNVDWLDQHKTLREVGVDANETLLLKRRLFYSDRNIDSRDPVQLNLLYVQTRDAILNGRHPVTENQAAECKIRWVHIRDVQRRILRKRLMHPGLKTRTYKYDSKLEFMKPFFKELSNCLPTGEAEFDDQGYDDNNELEQNPLEGVNDADSDDSYEPVKVKRERAKPKRASASRKRKSEIQIAEEPEKLASSDDTVLMQLDPKDPIDAFLLSIGSTLKTFSPYHLNLSKSEIFSVVQKHEMEQIIEEPR